MTLSTEPPRRLPAWALRLNARRRQALGLYDTATEAWFRDAWQHSRSAADLVAWLRFRRELGLVVDARQADLLASLLRDPRGAPARRAAELLIEGGMPTAVSGAPEPARFAGYADESPPIAACLREAGIDIPEPAARLADLHRQQTTWRDELGALLGGGAGAACIVGNAASLSGSRLGQRIDDHALVVRFNRWRSAATADADIGRRLDVWVCTSRFLPDLPSLAVAPPAWLVLSGPDARFDRDGRRVDWSQVLALVDQGVRVVTVPLDVWRDAVGPLEAPPSAGVLMLAWAQRLLVPGTRLAIAGFDSAGGGRYHHADQRQRPGRRHAWRREAALIDSWRLDDLQTSGVHEGAA